MHKKNVLIHITCCLLLLTLLISCSNNEHTTQDLSPKEIKSFYTDEIWNADYMTILRADGARKSTKNAEFIKSWLIKVGDLTVTPNPNPEEYSGVAYTITFFKGEDELLYFTPTRISQINIFSNDDFFEEMQLLWESEQLAE